MKILYVQGLAPFSLHCNVFSSFALKFIKSKDLIFLGQVSEAASECCFNDVCYRVVTSGVAILHVPVRLFMGQMTS